MKATALSIWCISTTVIAYSHAFILNIAHSPPRVRSLAQTRRDHENGDIMKMVTSSLLQEEDNNVDNHRRTMLLSLLSIPQLYSYYHPAPSYATTLPPPTATIEGIHDPQLQNYVHPALPHWKGTALSGPLSLSEAYAKFILPSLQNGKSNTADITDTITTTTFPMAKWPDPILRIPSSPIPSSTFQNNNPNTNNHQLHQLQQIAQTLRNTAWQEGAVGLAAQQCGIDASLIYIDGVVVTSAPSSSSSDAVSSSSTAVVMSRNDNGVLGMNKDASLAGVFGQSNWRNSKKQVTGEGVVDNNYNTYSTTTNNNNHNRPATTRMRKDGGIFLVNPRIISRSPESEMLVWTEECLVLPPEFRATLLRDAEVTIEYETLLLTTSTPTTTRTGGNDECCGETKQITLRGELARCAQHEMDHDRGVLIVDHVGLEELLTVKGVGQTSLMADVEDSDGRHGERMERAYAREVYESVLLPSVRTRKNVDLAFGNRHDFFSKIELLVEGDDIMDGRYVEHYSSHPWFVPSANAVESVTAENSALSTNVENTRPDRLDGTNTATSSSSSCDDACQQDRKRRIQERRAMMQQSRSSTNRGEVLELSRQRALMYGTSYNGLSPSACAKPGFCP